MVRYDGDGVVESNLIPLPIAVTSSLENTRDKSKIELCMCTCQPLVSEPKTRKEVRLW